MATVGDKVMRTKVCQMGCDLFHSDCTAWVSLGTRMGVRMGLY